MKPKNGIPVGDDEREQIVRSLTHGRKVREVADIYGRSERAVRLVAKAAGISVAPRTYKPQPKEYRDLALSLPLPLMAALIVAAKRRDLKPDALAVQLLHGVLAKGSVERTLAGFAYHHAH
jgi:hypothetical protein